MDSVNGDDEYDCLTDTTQCKTLAKAYEESSAGDTIKITLVSQTATLIAETKQINLEKGSVIEPNGEGSVNLPITSITTTTPTALFNVIVKSSGTVNFKFINFQMDTTEVINTYVFHVSLGTLSCSDCTFIPYTPSGREANSYLKNVEVVLKYSISRLIGGYTYFYRCTFQDLTLEKDDAKSEIGGAAISVTDKCNLTTLQTTFLRCKCNNGYGGAMYCDFSKGGCMNIKNNSTNTVFTSCSSFFKDENDEEIGKGGAIFAKAQSQENRFMIRFVDFTTNEDGTTTNEAKYGKNYYVCSTDLQSIVTYLNKYDKISTDHPEESMGSMYFDVYEIRYLKDPVVPNYEGKIYVSNTEEKEDENCGIESVPCPNIISTYGKITDEDYRIFIMTDTLKPEPSSITNIKDHSITFRHATYDSVVTMNIEDLNIDGDSKAIFDISTKNGGSLIFYKFKFVISKEKVPGNYIFYVKTAKLTLNECIVERGATGSSNLYASVICIDSSTADCEITSCTFTNLVLNVPDGSEKHGAVISGTVESKHSLIIKGSTRFDGCEASNGDGGAIRITVSGVLEIGNNNGDYVNFRDCKVNDDDTNGRIGGAMYVRINSNEGSKLSYITFGASYDSSHNNVAKYGQNIFYSMKGLDTNINEKDLFVVLYYGQDNKDRLLCADKEHEDITSSLFDKLYPKLFNSVTVSSDGDDDTCGTTANVKCKTIGKAYRLLSLYKGGTINVDENSGDLGPEPNQISIVKSITITGKAGKSNLKFKKMGSDTEKALFFIRFYMTVSVSSFSFVLMENTDTPDGSVFYVSNGALTVSSCDFKRDTPNGNSVPLSASLFTFYGSSIVIDSCSFNEIVLGSGDGSVFSGTLNDGMSLVIKGTTQFCRCKCPTGYGGAIDLYVKNGASLKIGETSDDKIYFAGCAAGDTTENLKRGGAIFADINSGAVLDVCFNYITFGQVPGETAEANTANEGPDMFIQSNDLNNIIWSYTFKVVETKGDDGKGRLVGLGTGGQYIEGVKDLISVLHKGHPNGVYVNTGSSGTDCTYKSPCGTISTAYSKVVNEKNIIFIMGNHAGGSVTLPSQNTNFKFTKPCTFKHTDTNFDINPIVKVIVILPLQKTSDDSALFSFDSSFTSGKVIFEAFRFLISSTTVPQSSIFSLANGYLYLSECEFKREDVSGINSMILSNTGELTTSVITMTGGTLSVNYCTFEGLTLNKVSDKKGGAAINAELSSGNIYITSCTFTNCICNEGYGGALYINRIKKADVQIYGSEDNKCSFTGCKSVFSDASEEGRGGAIFLSTTSFSIRHLKFANNVATYGKNIYLVSTLLRDKALQLGSQNGPLGGTVEDDEFMGSLTIDRFEDFPLNLIAKGFEGNIYVLSSSSTPDDLCGYVQHECVLLSTACNLVSDGTYNVLIEDNVGSGTKAVRVKQSLKLTIKPNEASDSVTRTVTIDSTSSLFSISGGTMESSLIVERIIFELTKAIKSSPFSIVIGKLSFSSCQFGIKSGGSIKTEASYIQMSGGNVVIENCQFTGINFLKTGYKGPAIYASYSEGSLELKGVCDFYQCVNEEGDGGAVYVDVSDKGFLYIGRNSNDNICFASCAAGKEGGYKNGGALYTKISTSAKNNIILDKITFGSKSDTTPGVNKAATGKDLLVESDNITFLLSTSTFPIIDDYNTPENQDSLIGFTTKDIANAKSLFLIITDFNSKILYVKKGSTDNNKCDSATPCSSLYYIFSTPDITTDKTDVVIVSDGDGKADLSSETKQIVIDEAVTIRPYTAEYISLSLTTITSSETEKSLFYINTVVRVNIKSFRFSLSADPDGSIFFIGKGYVYLYDCCFKGEGAASGYSRLMKSNSPVTIANSLLKMTGGELRCYRCSFDGFTLSNDDTSIVGGTAICGVLSTGVTLYLNGSTFNNCQCSKGYGGAVYLDASQKGNINVNEDEGNSLFDNCKAFYNLNGEVGRGGGLFINIHSSGTFYFRGVAFGKANVANYGKNFYVVSPNLNAIADYLFKQNVILSVTEKQKIMGSLSTVNYLDIDLYQVYLNHLENTEIYVTSSTETEAADCGPSEKPCYSLYTAFTKVSTREGYVLIKTDITGGSKTIVLNKPLDVVVKPEIKGEKKTITVITSTDGTSNRALFNFYYALDTTILSIESIIFEISDNALSYVISLQTGRLTLTSCTFKRTTGATKEIGFSVINAKNGTLVIDSCEFNDLTYTNNKGYKGSAIYCYGEEGSLELKGTCIFYKCTNIAGGGGAIDIELEKTKSVKVGAGSNDKIYFAGCKANNSAISKSRGGAIYVNLPVESKNNIMLKNIIFGVIPGTSAEANEAKQGQDLFVESDNIRDAVLKSKFPVVDKYSATKENLVGNNKKDLDTLSPIPLFNIINNIDEGLYVQSGASGEECTNVAPCALLSKAFNKLTKDNTITILKKDSVATLTAEDTYMLVKNNATVSGEDDISVTLPVKVLITIESSNPSLFHIQLDDSKTLTIKKFTFNLLTTNVLNGYVFYVESGTLICSDCEFKPSSSSLLKLSSSIMENTEVTLSYSVARLVGGETHFVRSRFEDVTLSKSVGSSEDGGAAISVTGNCKLYSDACVFTRCKSVNGYGGAIYFGNKDGYMNIRADSGVNSYFDSCSCTFNDGTGKDIGKGGAIFAKAETQSNHFMIRYVNFVSKSASDTSTTNEAQFGKDYYIVCTKMKTIVDYLNTYHKINADHPEESMGSTTFEPYENIKLSEYVAPPFKGNTIYVESKSGSEVDDCGESNNPCLSISSAYEKVKDREANIVLKSPNQKAETSPISIEGALGVTIKSNSGNSILSIQNIKVDEESQNLFSLNKDEGNKLTFERIRFEILNDDVPEVPVFFVNKGILTFSSCVVGRPSGATSELLQSIIRLGYGSLVINSCNFTGLKLNNANYGGTAIYGYVNEGHSLEIKGKCNFIGCESAGGNGGAVNLFVDGGSLMMGEGDSDGTYFASCKVSADAENGKRGGAIYIGDKTLNSDIYLNNLVFGTSSSSVVGENDANQGKNVFVYSQDLYLTVSFYTFTFLSSPENIEKKEDFLGVNMDAPGETIPLYDVGVISSIVFYVQKGGSGTDCTSAAPCGTLSSAYSKVNETNNRVLIKNNNGEEKADLESVVTQIVIDKVVSFTPELQGRIKLPVVALTDSSSSVFLVKAGESKRLSVKFTYFDFVISRTSIPNGNIFFIESGYIYMNETTFSREGSSSMNYNNILSNDDPTPLTHSVVSMAGGIVVVCGCSFSGLTLTKTGDDALAENGGAAISGTISDPDSRLMIRATNFTSCSCTNGYGGAIYFDAVEEGGFNINDDDDPYYKVNSIFGYCSSQFGDNEGRGGAVFVKVSSYNTHTFNFRYVEFTKKEENGQQVTTNNAALGKNYYIICSDLDNLVNEYLKMYTLNVEEPSSDAMGSFMDELYEDLPLIYIANTPEIKDQILVNDKNGAYYCGYEAYPCGSIYAAYGIVTKELTLITISSSSTSVGYSSISVSASLAVSVKPKEDATESVTVYVGKVQQIKAPVEEGGEPTVEEVSVFDFSSADTKSELNMERLSFEISYLLPFNKAMFAVSKGKLGLNKCKFLRQPIPTSENTNTSSYLSNDEEVKVDPLGASVILLNGGIVDLTLTSFTSLSRSEGNGCSIEAIEGAYSLTVTNTSFYNCSCLNGNGGALYVNLVEGSSIVLGKDKGDNTTFEKCSAVAKKQTAKGSNDDTNGKGGAMYINIPTTHGTANVDNVMFKNNEAEEGGDFYSIADTLDLADDPAMFPFLEDKDRYTDCYITDIHGNRRIKKGNSSKSGKDGFPGWAIAVIVIAVIVVILIIVGIVVGVICARKNSRKDNYDQKEDLRQNEEMKEVNMDGQGKDDSMTAEDAAIREDM